MTQVHYVIPCIRFKVDKSQFPGTRRGPVTASTSVYLQVLRHLDSSSGAVRIAAIDLFNAFDRVTHGSIINACRRLRVPKDIFQLISSFLPSRLQRFTVNGWSSVFVPVISGVPQDSSVGLVFFSLAVDSYAPVCNIFCFLIKYSDDLFYS